MSGLFDEGGPSEDDARKLTMPAFLETELGGFKSLQECSRSGIEGHINSLTMQAQGLIDEAKTLARYLDSGEDGQS